MINIVQCQWYCAPRKQRSLLFQYNLHSFPQVVIVSALLTGITVSWGYVFQAGQDGDGPNSKSKSETVNIVIQTEAVFVYGVLL